MKVRVFEVVMASEVMSELIFGASLPQTICLGGRLAPRILMNLTE